MASLGSFIRSAARATSSAYRRLPIRWRLAGGSAAADAGDPVRLRRDRRRADHASGSSRTSTARSRARPTSSQRRSRRAPTSTRRPDNGIRLAATTARPRRLRRAARTRSIRIVTARRRADSDDAGAPDSARRRARRSRSRRLPHRVAADRRPTPIPRIYVQYARRLSDVAGDREPREGVPRPRRARRRRARAAGRARHRAPRHGADRRAHRRRPRDRAHPRPVAAHPPPRGRGRGGRARPHAGGDARTRSTRRAAETEAALARQREFVADASHELRTPLTSVLANLELLEEELEGEPREAAASALRSSRRMRRLVADLLLLARADAGREAPHGPLDLSEVVTEAAAELEPVAGEHEITVSAPPGAERRGRARRAAPPRAEPAGERAAPHRPRHGRGGDGRAPQRRGRARGRGRRAGHPARAAREGLRALLPRRRRPQRLERASGSRSCAPSPSRTAATCGSSRRSTAAARASWCASRPAH